MEITKTTVKIYVSLIFLTVLLLLGDDDVIICARTSASIHSVTCQPLQYVPLDDLFPNSNRSALKTLTSNLAIKLIKEKRRNRHCIYYTILKSVCIYFKNISLVQVNTRHFKCQISIFSIISMRRACV